MLSDRATRRMVGTARMQRMATIAFAPRAALLPAWLHPNDFAGAPMPSDRAAANGGYGADAENG